MTDPTPDLLRLPTLPRIVERLQSALADEATRREAFFEWLTPDTKAEFINGDIVMPSPARDAHIAATGRLVQVLGTYVTLHGLGMVRAEKSLVSLTRNDYEPDVCFFGTEKAARITPATLRYPAPDLAVEVLSESTEARDRGVKMDDYAAHGVAEYWIVDADAQTVEQYLLDEPAEAYRLAMKSASGEIASVAVDGLVLPVRAVFDDAAALAALRAILA